MIASLSGVVESVSTDRVILDVGGVGYLLYATPATLAALRVGERARLVTVLVIREDSQTLFGFADDDERDLFARATSVTGVGPRIGLSLLSVHSPAAIRLAVQRQDQKAFTQVSGIGPKVAARLLLELEGKIGAPSRGAPSPSDGPASPAVQGTEHRDQVIAALTGLGFQVKPATEAVAQVLAERASADVSGADVATVLRDALKVLRKH
jgi:Holliday junction DNA helicase RuvA